MYENFKMDNELSHHGTKGMKWGERRYQNHDGTWTEAGKKRRRQGNSSSSSIRDKISAHKKKHVERAAAKRQAKIDKAKPDYTTRNRKLSDMSEDELRSRLNRLNLEKQVYEAERNVAAYNPKKVSAGKKFVNSMMNDVLGPAAREAGKKVASAWMEKKGKELLGLNESKTEAAANTLKALKEESEKLGYKKQIDQHQRYFKSMEKKDQQEAEAAAKKAEAEAAKAAAQAKKEAEKAAQAKKDARAKKIKKLKEKMGLKDEEEAETHEGEVIGEGRSKSSIKNQNYKDGPSADIVSKPVSDVSGTPSVITGQSYVAEILFRDKK